MGPSALFAAAALADRLTAGHRAALEAVAQALVEHETLAGDEVAQLVRARERTAPRETASETAL